MKKSKQGAPDSARLSCPVGTDPAGVMNTGGGVMNTPSRARTRVVCHTGVNEDNPFIAIPRTREGAHARDVRSKAALAA